MKHPVKMHWSGKVLEVIVQLIASFRGNGFLKLQCSEVSFGFRLLPKLVESVTSSFELIRSKNQF